MICHTGLRIVVGADLFRAVAGADHGAAGGIQFFLPFLLFHIVQTCTQNGHGTGFVLQLGAFILAGDDHAGGQVDQADGCGVLLNVLAAGSCGFIDFDANVGFRNLNVEVFYFRQYRDGDRGGMDASLRLGDGNTLNAVCSGFILQTGVSALPFDHKGDFLITADADFIFGKDLDMPAAGFRVVCVHAEQVCREQGGFITAGAGANFNDHVFGIPRIFGNQQRADLFFKLFNAGFEFIDFHLSQFRHFVVRSAGQFFGIVKLLQRGFIFAPLFDDLFDVGPFFQQFVGL